MRVVVERRRAHQAAPSCGQRVFVGFIILCHTLVIIAQSHRHAQRFCQVIGRLMVESAAPSGVMIELRCGIIGGKELRLNGVVEPLIEAKCAHHPVVTAVVFGRTQRELLAHERLFQACYREKQVARCEILVNLLLVFTQLNRCLAVEMHRISFVEPIHSSREKIATIIAGAIVIHGIGGVIGCMIEAIWIAALRGMVEKCVETHRPKRRGLPGKSHFGIGTLQVVGLRSRIKVAEKTIVVVVIGRHIDAQARRNFLIMVHAEAQIVARTIADFGHGVLIIQRRIGVDVDESASGIASIKRALWTAKHLNTADSGNIHVDNRPLKIGHSVDI